MNNVIEVKIDVTNIKWVDNSYIEYQFHVRVVVGTDYSSIKWETTLNKRYSDFVKLEKDMLSELKTKKCPFDLPKKKYSIWSKYYPFSNNDSTNDTADHYGIEKYDEDETIRERKSKLAKYLYDILNNTFDRKWRDSKSMTKFLGLKDGISDWSALLNGLRSDTNRNEYGADFSSNNEDSWLIQFRDCKNDLLQCRNLSQYRNYNSDTSSDTNGTFLDSLMRLRLKVNTLQTDLSQSSNKGKNIDQDELVRRQNLLKMLKHDITELSSNSSIELSCKRNTTNLMKPISNGNRRRFGETSETEKLDDRELYMNNRIVLQKQNQDLEQLHDIIQRQKVLSLAMNEELQQQNELLDDFSNDVDRVYGKIRNTNEKASKFNR